MAKVPQTTADAAQRVAEEFNAAVKAAKADSTLSAVGKQQAMARAYLSASQEMSRLREGFDSGVQVTARDIQRELFGAPMVSGADAISIRDAADRASRVETGNEALTLLQQAEMNGDDHLARAVASRAFEGLQDFFGSDTWAPVLEAYTERRPDVATRMEELHEAQTTGADDAFRNAGLFALFKPSELDHVPDYRLPEVAGIEEPA